MARRTGVGTMARRVVRLSSILLLWPLAAAGQQQPANVPLDVVLTRAADYADRFLDRFANVVTEERYEQTLVSMTARTTRIRTLRSDLAFIRTGGALAWTELRDVFEVDGRAVRDRNERLVKLFTEGAPDALDQGTRISEESARYNIGPGTRTVNTPVLPLLFVQRSVQPRFVFSLGPPDRSVGSRVRVVAYREQATPTLVRGDNDVNLPSAGRLWIDVDTGAVHRVEMELVSLSGRWRLTTDFTMDDRLDVAVPKEMRERYEAGGALTTGIATYGRFRSFNVTTSDIVQDPQ